MSINDDVLDDIEEDELKKDNSLSPELINLITGADISLNLLEESNNKLNEYTDIESDIVANESISRYDAELIQQVFGGLFKDRVSLEEFTLTPSQTNYTFTKKYIAETIAINKVNFQNRFIEFSNKTLRDIKKALEELNDSYTDNLVSDLSKLKFDLTNMESKIRDNKDYILPYGAGFANITTVHLNTLDISKLSLDDDTAKSIKATLDSLNLLLSNTDIKVFIAICLGNKVFTDIFNKENSLDIELDNFSALDLLYFILSSSVEDFSFHIKSYIDGLIDKIDKLQELSESAIETYESSNQYLIDNRLNIQKTIKEALIIGNLTINLSSLYIILTDLFNFYKKY